MLNVPANPTVAGARKPVPASLYRYNWFAALTYSSRQEFPGAAGLKLAVNQTHTDARSVAPNGSAYSSANVCWTPEPLLGVTDTVVGGALVTGTVQLPIVCHPLPALDPEAYMNVVFAPAYAAANVTGRFKVRFVPDVVTLAVAMLIEH